MADLMLASNFPDPDEAYNAIIDAHRGLDEAASTAFNARLILLLANHIGDHDVLRQALALAKEAAATDS